MPKALDLTGQRFGSLVAIEKVSSKKGKTYWKCRCDCGVEKEIQTGHLTSGVTQTCGNSDCPYHLKAVAIGQQANENEKKVCEICGYEFIPNSPTRKYCFECSPQVSETVSRGDAITAFRQSMKKQAVKMRGGKCERCGYDKSIYALSFHHRDPKEKLFKIGSGDIKNWQDYLAEVEKCDLLCANCHAEEHERQDKEKLKED